MLKVEIAKSLGLSISKLHDVVKSAGLPVKDSYTDEECLAIQEVFQKPAQSQPQQQRPGATAGTPQDALATIQQGIQPVARYVLDTHANLVQQRDRFIEGAVEATIQEIQLTPALYLQELQKALQGGAIAPKDQMVQAFDLNPVCTNVFSLPPTSQGGLDAQKLLNAAE